MNILIFSTIYPAPVKYGIPSDTKVVHYYAEQWKNMGHTVQVIYLHMIPIKKILNSTFRRKIGGFESDYEMEGIHVHLLEYQLLIPHANNLTTFQAKNAEKRITDFLKKSLIPDKVFVHFPCSFRGIKCLTDFSCPTMAVLHHVDLQLLRKNPRLSDELNQYQTIGGRNCRICDTVSKLLSRKTVLVLSGIERLLVPQLEWIEKKLKRESQIIKITYAGNLIPLKNVDIIIKTLQKVSFKYQFEIIGDGPERKRLMLLAKKDNSIIFRGRMSREATIEKMRESDVFLMVSSPETFGLVYIEAMAQGCITIGSRNEGIDGVIRDGENGFLVKPRNIEELKECLEKIVFMPKEQKQEIVHSAYRDAAKMTDENMANKYLQLNIVYTENLLRLRCRNEARK